MSGGDAPPPPPRDLPEIIIRAATNADAARVKALVFRVLNEYGLSPDPAATDADLDDIEAHYLKTGGMFELIEDTAGNLLGTVGLYPVDNETCELRKMYFAPEVRGRGLGARVLKRTLDRARELGFRRVELETASVLEGAIRLYTRFGFRPLPNHHLAPRADRAFFLDLR